MLLDELDLMIMAELEDDARQPVRALARKIGVNRETVRYRLNRLTDEGILRMACTSDAERLGYHFLLLIGIRVAPGKADAVASHLASLSVVKGVALAAGPYSIMVWASLQNQSDLARFVSENLTCTSDITDIEIMHAYQWIKEPGSYSASQQERGRRPPPEKLSDLDLSIINAMELDPKQTIKNLAGTVGCSMSVAKTALERLMDCGLIRFVTLFDPTALGYDLSVVILCKCMPERVHAVATQLAEQDTPGRVSLITGHWHIYFGGVFQSGADLQKFLMRLTGIPGVIEFEVVHLGRKYKYSGTITLSPSAYSWNNSADGEISNGTPAVSSGTSKAG